VFLTYVLSFIFLGIYWNNHHHMLQATQHINAVDRRRHLRRRCADVARPRPAIEARLQD
jgi:hypothetical protein